MVLSIPLTVVLLPVMAQSFTVNVLSLTMPPRVTVRPLSVTVAPPVTNKVGAHPLLPSIVVLPTPAPRSVRFLLIITVSR
jgi:hypothetical protein